MLFSIFNVLRIYKALQILFYKFLLKWGKNEDFESTIFFETQKYYFVFESRLSFFSKWSYSQCCFDVAQRCENRRWKWQRCFDVVYRCSLQHCFNVVNFIVDVHNVVSTSVWRCATLRSHINLKRMLNRRWNVCWARPKRK